jgi:hypothetical protein
MFFGCGCKGQVKQEKIVPDGIRPIQVQSSTEIESPKYTIEDIIRIKDYLTSTNKHDLEKQFIAYILGENFGDVIPDYCDQNCLKHIQNRVKQMENSIKEYEKFILKK